MLLLDAESPQQRIRLAREPARGLCLYLGDTSQFVERDEHRYHESIGVVPMLFRAPRRVLIAGGGDGLVATRVLKFPSVRSVVVCDFDPMMTRIAREEPALAELNERSFDDPRTRVVNDDAFAFIARCSERFDLILCDFPDPYLEPLGRLYSREIYEAARALLGDDGVLVTQACMVPGTAEIIRATVASVFPHTSFYRTFFPRPVWCGFVVGSNRPLGTAAPVPPWTRYLNDAVVASLFALAKDEVAQEGVVNTLANGALVRHTLQGALKTHIGRTDTLDDRRFVAFVDGATPVDAAYVSPLLGYIADEQPLVVYVGEALCEEHDERLRDIGCVRRGDVRRLVLRPTPENHARLESLWAKLDDTSVTALEVHVGRACDHADVARLLHDAVLEHIDLPSRDEERLAAQSSHYVLARDAKGEAVAMARLAFDGGLRIELARGGRTPRERVLAALLVLGYVLGEWMDVVNVFALEGPAARFFTRLGFTHEGTYGVYERTR